ncbi:MAG: MFS transporter, partial [Clostridia bacterium]|nr:MFS transporter [Clostridia bacterium]
MYGYSIGHIGQSITYGFISTYLVVYLTDGVGLSSSTAATISALALIVEFFVGMIVGNASDNCTSKMGRRRPFMMTAGIFIIPIMAMLFHIFDFGSSFNFAYYLLFAILFRVCFASWEITNAAFGAEIALGYDERTKLRTISRVCSVFGNGVAYVLPVYMLELFDTKEAAWEITGVLVAAVASVSWFTSVIVNRGRGVILTERLEEKGKGLGFLSVARNYLELLKLKSARILVLYKVGFTCSYALINVALMYYMEYSAGLSNNFKTYV